VAWGAQEDILRKRKNKELIRGGKTAADRSSVFLSYLGTGARGSRLAWVGRGGSGHREIIGRVKGRL